MQALRLDQIWGLGPNRKIESRQSDTDRHRTHARYEFLPAARWPRAVVDQETGVIVMKGTPFTGTQDTVRVSNKGHVDMIHGEKSYI